MAMIPFPDKENNLLIFEDLQIDAKKEGEISSSFLSYRY
jgi:hypothetical protein